MSGSALDIAFDVVDASAAPMSSWLIIDAAGAAINRVSWDGVSDWSPPEGCTVVADDGRALAEPPRPSSISASAFLARMTDAEQLAIAAASAAHPVLLVAMTRLGAAVAVDLLEPQVAGFLAQAVAAGAITAERAAVIRTP